MANSMNDKLLLQAAYALESKTVNYRRYQYDKNWIRDSLSVNKFGK